MRRRWRPETLGMQPTIRPSSTSSDNGRPGPLGLMVMVAWMASGLMVALLSTVAPVDAETSRAESAPWSVDHVLVADSRASRWVAESLLAHPPDPRAHERIVWVGPVPDDIPARAAALGYAFEVAGADDRRARLAQLGPVLRIATPDARVVYQGGYASVPRGPIFEDRNILNALIAGQPVAAYPTAGSRPG